MEILLDTNIILDYLTEREGHENAKKVIEKALCDDVEFVSAFSITDIHYFLSTSIKLKDSVENDRNKRASLQSQEKIRELLDIVSVLPVTANDILVALDLRWVDFEDALQYSIALNNNIETIITKNIKDFKSDKVTILTPEQFLKIS